MNTTRLEDVIDKTGMPTIDPETGYRRICQIVLTPTSLTAAEKASVAIFLGVPMLARGIGDTK